MLARVVRHCLDLDLHGGPEFLLVKEVVQAVLEKVSLPLAATQPPHAFQTTSVHCVRPIIYLTEAKTCHDDDF